MAGTNWYVFAAATKARGSQVNSNFDWIEGNIVPQSAGATASNTYDLGTTAAKWRTVYAGTSIVVGTLTLTDSNGAFFASGTKMVFYQASAPTGWTAVAENDKFLRVVTAGGTGGSTGGTVAASTSLSHSHTVNSHSHTVNVGCVWNGANASDPSPTDYWVVDINGTIDSSQASRTSGSTSAETPGTDSQLGVFAYADVIIATKD